MTIAQSNHVKYAGFWIRLAATMIDSALLLMVMGPLFFLIYGPSDFAPSLFLQEEKDIIYGQLQLAPITTTMYSPLRFFISVGLPLIAVLIFWRYKSATPGKMLYSLQIVDANTLQKPTARQFIIRYFSYVISTLPFCLGFLWIAFDKRKQGWHDKLAQTVVIRRQS